MIHKKPLERMLMAHFYCNAADGMPVMEINTNRYDAVRF